jgi:hypothetical protein
MREQFFVVSSQEPPTAAGGAALSVSAVGAGALKARGRHPARRRYLPATALATGSGSG